MIFGKKVTKEDIKEKASTVKDLAVEHKEGIFKALKFSLYFGLGAFIGGRVESAKLQKELKKVLPDFCYQSGAKGMDSYKAWLKDNIPDVIAVVNEFVDNNPDKEWVDPYFLSHPDIVRQFMICGVDPIDYAKKIDRSK